MDKKYYLGFDAGTQSVKVAIYDEAGQEVAMATAPTTLLYPQPGWVQMDVGEYYQLIKQCMRDCSRQMAAKGLDVGQIRSIMGDGVICGIVCVDAEGNAISPYINYLDSRTSDDVEALKAQHLSIWAEETGNPEPHIMFPAMYARWFLKNIPAVRNGA
jgi:xylulokinase